MVKRSWARNLLTIAAAAVSAFCGAQSADGWSSVAPPPSGPNGIRIDQKLGSQVPLDVSFQDRKGNTVSFGETLESRPTLVLPIFYRCTSVCNTELQGLLKALPKMPKRPGRDFNIVVLSIDPKEGPALAEGKFESTMKALPMLKGTEGGWHFLTGSLQNIQRVTDSIGFQFRYDAATDKINHPSGLILLTPDGRVSSYVLNPYFTSAVLSRDLALAVTNTIGQKSEDIFFGCIHCDPVTGKRSIVIGRFLSIAALATVLGLIALVGSMFYKARDRTYAS